MWGEPIPKWRRARKQHQCQGDGCAKVIATGERYLDRALRQPTNGHLRYCQQCAEPVIARANGYHMFNGRSDFPDRYHQRISSAQWKTLKRKVIEQIGNRCQRCGKVNAALALHHVHYRSLGSEQPEDVELLCPDCHTRADEARAAKGRPQYDEPEDVLIVGPNGDHWGKLDPDTIYIPLKDSRFVPVPLKRNSSPKPQEYRPPLNESGPHRKSAQKKNIFDSPVSETNHLKLEGDGHSDAKPIEINRIDR